MRALPSLVLTIARLVKDPALPRSAKVALMTALVYLVSPFDLVPEFVPWLGYVDDLLVAAVVLDGILNFVDRDVVLRYWPGSERSLQTLARTARTLAAWVPRSLKARIFR